MVITNIVPEQLVRLMVNDNPSTPLYIAVGTASTVATRSDTVLGKEEARVLKSESGSENGVAWIQGVINSITGTANSFTEIGTFDDSSAGNLYERETISGIEHTSTSNTRITRFMSINPTNTIKSIITDVGVDQVANWLAGTTFTEPSHIAWGTELILDSNETLGSGGNAWNASTDAGTAQLEFSDFQEGTASIRMGKEGSSVTRFFYDRTLASSINASNATEFRIWINPKDADDFNKLTASGTALTIKIGNDVNNYKFSEFKKEDLFVGWQRLKSTISSMSSSGNPDMSAIDYMEINWESSAPTDTITKGNLLMDYWSFHWNIDETDTSLRDEKFRGTVGTKQKTGNIARFKEDMEKVDGNPFNYTNTGLFNANTSGDMFFENEHIRIKKDSTTKIIQEVSIKFGIKQ